MPLHASAGRATARHVDDGTLRADITYVADFNFTTFRVELNHRVANVPYFAGSGGVTPPGGNTGAAGSRVDGCAPDLRPAETRATLALLVKL